MAQNQGQAHQHDWTPTYCDPAKINWTQGSLRGKPDQWDMGQRTAGWMQEETSGKNLGTRPVRMIPEGSGGKGGAKYSANPSIPHVWTWMEGNPYQIADPPPTEVQRIASMLEQTMAN